MTSLNEPAVFSGAFKPRISRHIGRDFVLATVHWRDALGLQHCATGWGKSFTEAARKAWHRYQSLSRGK